VVHQAYGHLVLGRYSSGPSLIGEALVSRWRSTGASVEYSSHLEAVRWQKTLWNASFSSLCTISNSDTATVLGNAEQLVRKVMDEIHETATRLGHELPVGIIEKQINGTHRMPPYLPSMALDQRAGDPTEREVIVGNAVRAARRAGVKTPHLDTVYALLKLQE
jgi:2-dehydropantoate 2-reductase